jgi:outer membrane protein
MLINSRFYTLGILAAALVASTSTAMATQAGDWLVRARVINVAPATESGDLSTISGAQVDVEAEETVEVDFTYMMTRKLGLELILATTNHDIAGDGILKGTKIGSAGVLPPTLTLQYHFAPHASTRPYAGVGVNYTHFYDVESDLGGTNVELENSVGMSAQVGTDYSLTNGWFMNVDAKYIDMDTTATLTGAVNGSVDVDIDPWVLSMGIGKSF